MGAAAVQNVAVAGDEAGPAGALAEQVRGALTDISTGLDARFIAAGKALERAVETIDRVVRGLCDVGQAFAQGEAGTAIDRLVAAAGRLHEVPEQQARRSAEVGRIRAISTALSARAAEVARILEVLRIYGVNVKIASSGAQDFIDFAERMHVQLEGGERQIASFRAKMSELEEALAGIEKADGLLRAECAKVLPQVPDRLVSDAAGLRERQAGLSDVAAQAGRIAREIQVNVAAVLGAMQIGDITRQRLEHVVTGCELLDACLAEHGEAASGEAFAPVLHLLAAQIEDAAQDFGRETAQLMTALERMAPDAERLLSFGKGTDFLGESRDFLRRVEAGVAEADKMTGRLRDADQQAASITALVLATADDLSARTRAMKNLRIDVQQMAINIGLRCRQVELIGKPIAVIANEIRGCSDELGAVALGIGEGGERLATVSVEMREGEGTAGDVSENSLARAIEAIGEGARSTEAAMASAGDEAGEIVGLLRDTSSELGSSLALQETMAAMAAQLTAAAQGPAEPPEEPDERLLEVMTQIARLYTMASERAVHARFLPADMQDERLSVAEAVEMDDDDALF